TGSHGVPSTVTYRLVSLMLCSTLRSSPISRGVSVAGFGAVTRTTFVVASVIGMGSLRGCSPLNGMFTRSKLSSFAPLPHRQRNGEHGQHADVDVGTRNGRHQTRDAIARIRGRTSRSRRRPPRQ